jgi:hypothetical protein
VPAVREAVDERGAGERLERVARGDAERRGERAGGGDVDDERADEDGRPHAVAEQQHRRERDPGRRPHGGGARVHQPEHQPELAGHDVGAGEEHLRPEQALRFR